MLDTISVVKIRQKEIKDTEGRKDLFHFMKDMLLFKRGKIYYRQGGDLDSRSLLLSLLKNALHSGCGDI